MALTLRQFDRAERPIFKLRLCFRKIVVYWHSVIDSGQIGKGEKWGFLLGHKCPKQGEKRTRVEGEREGSPSFYADRVTKSSRLEKKRTCP